MTAALFNGQGGNFANVVDAYVYPQFIGYPQRAPTTQDIYQPGTRWQDNSVNPPVQYYTVGAGLWYQTANTAFGVSSVTGTANQITASPTTGNVVLTIPVVFAAPGSISSTTTIAAGTSASAATTITAGTGITSTTGNITASAGNLVATLGSVSAGTTVTAGTSITATLGNITATNGNIVKGTAGNKDVYTSVASTTTAGANSAGTVALIGGTIVVSTSAVTANSLIRLTCQALGTVTVPSALCVSAKSTGANFTILASQGTDTSTIFWEIVN